MVFAFESKTMHKNKENVHTYLPTYVGMYIHTYIHVRIYIYICTYIHIYIYLRVWLYIHMYMYTQTDRWLDKFTM